MILSEANKKLAKLIRHTCQYVLRGKISKDWTCGGWR